MPSRNDITGDTLRSKNNSKQYRSNWDRIFNKKDEPNEEPLSAQKNETAIDDFAAKMDAMILGEVCKEAHLTTHCEEVKRAFGMLYPDTPITDEQIRLITLMWEEVVKDEIES